MSTQQSYRAIVDMIQTNVSIDQVRLAAKRMGISQNTMDTLFDLISPFSELKKAQYTVIMRAQIKSITESKQLFQALLKQNAQLRQMEAELLAESKGGSRSNKIKDDFAKQPAKSAAKEQESLLAVRLAEQNAEADSLCGEIKGIDQQIDTKLQGMITALLTERTSQTEQFDKMLSVLQTALEQNKQQELDKISGDDPERALKVAAIEEEYATKISALTAHQQDAKALDAETTEQVAKLMTDSSIKLSQGQSLNLAVTKLVIMQQPQRLGIAVDVANAQEKIAVYEKIYGNPSELERLQQTYNSLSQQHKELTATIKQEANIAEKQEITPELVEQFSPELQAKYHQLLILENERDTTGFELAHLKNFFGTQDKVAIDKIIKDAELYLNVSTAHLNLNTLGERVQAAEIDAERRLTAAETDAERLMQGVSATAEELGAGRSLQGASVIANEVIQLLDKKMELVDKLQNSLESRAETVLGQSTLRAEQAKALEQNLSPTPEQASPEQQNNLLPGNR